MEVTLFSPLYPMEHVATNSLLETISSCVLHCGLKKVFNKKTSLIYWVFISNFIASFYTKAPENQISFYAISSILLATLSTLKTFNSAFAIISCDSVMNFPQQDLRSHSLKARWGSFCTSHWLGQLLATVTGNPSMCRLVEVFEASPAPAMRRFPIPALKEQTSRLPRFKKRVWVWVCHQWPNDFSENSSCGGRWKLISP